MGLIPKNNPVKRDISKGINVFIYADPQFGKTTFASQAPNPIMFNTDGNIKMFDTPAISLKNGTVVTLPSGKKLSMYEYARQAIIEAIESTEYETIVIDLVEDLYEICMEHVVTYKGKKAHINEFSDNVRGMAYKSVQDNFVGILKLLRNSGKNVIYLGHKKELIQKVNGEEKTSFKSFLSDKMQAKLTGHVDMYGLATIRTGQDKEGNRVETRALYINPTDSVVAGNRYGISTKAVALNWTALKNELAKANK